MMGEMRDERQQNIEQKIWKSEMLNDQYDD